MAESIKGYGKILGDTNFEFSLDGMASFSQMKKLISVTEAVAKKIGADTAGPTKDEKAEVELLKDKNKQTEKGIDLDEQKRKTSDELDKKFRALNKTTEFFKGNLSAAGSEYTTGLTLLTTGVGTLIGSLTGYADQLQLGLQRGISGGIMDFAIAAKTGGVSLTQFSKALEESGGGFASLGIGATDGAKQFGGLISSVREATAGVGNMGLSNEQLANFTAQQTKVAISQGFKGKAAQDVVIKNSRSLGNELDTLANRTGKSVLELTQAAIKLAQDPIVANFVQSAKNGGAQVSKAVQQFGASLRGIFGEAGDAIASDTLKTALGNLPLVITQTGKNMITASSAVYSELERQAKIIKNGGEITAEDQEKLRNTVLKEVQARGAELRMLANLEGQAGDGARQLLALAEQANFYNSAAGKQRREEDKAAQAFNSSINQFKANLQALSIPLLKLVNAIPWDFFIKTLNIFVDTLSFVLRPFAKLGDILNIGFKDLNLTIGAAVSGIAGVVAGFTVMKTGLQLFRDTISKLSGSTLNLNSLFQKLQATLYHGMLGGAGGKAGGMGGVISGGTGGSGPAAGSMGGWQSGPFSAGQAAEAGPGRFDKLNNSKFGKLASRPGFGMASWMGGAALDYGSEKLKANGMGTAGSLMSVGSGALSGASTGAMIGSVIPGLGTAAGAIIGGALGAVGSAVSEWRESESATGLPGTASDAVDQNNNWQQQQLAELKGMRRDIVAQTNGIDANAGYAARQVALLGDNNRIQKDRMLYNPT
jgi:hypothetical protein